MSSEVVFVKKIAGFLVDRRYLLLAVLLAFTAVCGLLIPKVAINKDRTEYLADDSNMKQGIAIINSDFPEESEKSSIRVMFDNLTP